MNHLYTHEEFERINFLFCYISKEELIDMIIFHERLLKEIREYINKNSIYFATSEKVGNYFANCSTDELLEIIDKGLK